MVHLNLLKLIRISLINLLWLNQRLLACLLERDDYCICNVAQRSITCASFLQPLDEILPNMVPLEVRSLTLRKCWSEISTELNPNHFQRFVMLEFLSLSENLIVGVQSETFSDFPLLRSIDLSSNRIRLLENDVFSGNLPKLEYINLSNNKLVIIFEETFKSAKSLLQLDIRNNPIAFFASKAFGGLTRLVSLKLSGCNVRNLPNDLLQPLVNLTHFEIKKLKNIKEIPDNIFKTNTLLKSLYLNEMVKISQNQIYNNAFAGLTQLPRLAIVGCNLTAVPSNALRHLDELRYLDLSRNPIQIIGANDFLFPMKLEVLKFRNNNLRRVLSGAFRLQINLKLIDLSNNRLSTLKQDVFPENLTELRTVRLEKNPWRCDCLIAWIVTSHILASDQVTCLTPLKFQGKSFSEIGDFSIPCVAPNIDKSTNVGIAEAPTGNDVELPCFATGIPQPLITWHTPLANTINKSDSRLSNNTLRIQGVTLHNAGRYRCEAVNEFGRDEKTITLKVSNNSVTTFDFSTITKSVDKNTLTILTKWLIGMLAVTTVVGFGASLLLAIWGWAIQKRTLQPKVTLTLQRGTTCV